MFSACEIIQLLSVLFCVVRTVYKFDFRLYISDHEKEDQAKADFIVFDKICILFPHRRPNVKGLRRSIVFS